MQFSLNVGGSTEELTLLGDVRSVSERPVVADAAGGTETFFGVQFRSLNRYQQLLLHAWVMGRQLADASKKTGG